MRLKRVSNETNGRSASFIKASFQLTNKQQRWRRRAREGVCRLIYIFGMKRLSRQRDADCVDLTERMHAGHRGDEWAEEIKTPKGVKGP